MTTVKQAAHTPKASTLFIAINFTLLNIPLFASTAPIDSFTLKAIIMTNMVLSFLAIRTYNRSQPLFTYDDITRAIPIFIQSGVQLSIFVYIMLMNPQPYIRETVLYRMPLILYQVFFALAVDYLLHVFRGKVYRPQFYVIPMVLSINLFLWFLGSFFIAHLIMICAGILIKTYVVRKNRHNGKPSQIFNPSFIVLTLTTFIIFFFYNKVISHVYSLEIAYMYETTPGFDIFVLCVGCISLWLPNAYLVSLGAFSTVMLLNFLTEHFFGLILFFGLTKASVMIAIMIGITDPKTSPYSLSGKLLFGVAYGLILTSVNLIFVSYDVDFLSYYAKILSIPILNIISNKFDDIHYAAFLNHLSFYTSRISAIMVLIIIFTITYQPIDALFAQPNFLQVVAENIRMLFGLPHLRFFEYR